MTDSRPELRLWPGVVILALQWFAAFGTGYIAPGTMLQFFGMVGGPLGGAALLALWWLFLSRAAWPDRIGGLALCVVGYLGASALVHETAAMALSLYGLPVLCLGFVGWLVASRSLAVSTRRVGMLVVVLVACGVWTLLRTNGVDGQFDVDFAWRWSATAEERFLASAAVAPVSGATDAALATEAAWPGFRGPSRDSRVSGVMIATDWEASPPEELWRRPIGPGWSSFAVVGDLLYTQEQRADDEVVSCYSAETGEPLWVHQDTARFWEALGGAGPRATPTFHAGRLYTLGATGVLNCLDAATGARIWSRNIADDTGAAVPDWGFASSPLVAGELVVVHAGGPDGKGVAAYDLGTGEPRWFAPAGSASYSSPHLATIDGVPQLLMVTGDGASGHDPETGAVLWEHAWPLEGGARIVQPNLTADGDLLIGTGFSYGVRLLTVSRETETWRVDEGWTSRNLKPYFNDFVVHGDHAYGFDGSILACMDLRTGERAWKRGRYGNGQVLLLADQDLLLVLSERGELALVAADPAEFTEIARMPAIEGKTWNHPVIADGRLFVRNGEEAAAFRLPVTPVRSSGARYDSRSRTGIVVTARP